MASYLQNHMQYQCLLETKTAEPRNGRLPALMRLSQDGCAADPRNGFGGQRGYVETNHFQNSQALYNHQNQFIKAPAASSGYYGAAEESNSWRQSNGVQLQMLREDEVGFGGGPCGNPSRSRRPSHGPQHQLPFGPNHGSSNSKQVETDPVTLARRKKQIDYGKNTREYSNFVRSVPKEDRKFCHPKTPPMFRKYSRRAWDGLIKQWRLNLHDWSDTGEDFRELPNPSLNTSFSSETGSTSTTSSMARSSFAILQEMQRGFRIPEQEGLGAQDWKRLDEPLFVDTTYNSHHQGRNQQYEEPHFFSPPVQRPSSSLCFPSTYQHFSSGMDFLMNSRRQAQSQSNLSTVWQKDFDSLMDLHGRQDSCRMDYNAGECKLNGNGFGCVSNDLPFRFDDLKLADKLF